MPTFIKTGFWRKDKKPLAGELNLEKLIQENLPTPSEGNFIPITGTEAGKPVTGSIEFPFDSSMGIQSVLEETTQFGFKIGDRPEMWNINDNGKTSLTINDINLVISSENPTSIGLYSETDYSEISPTEKRIYAQRAYVDKLLVKEYIADLRIDAGVFSVATVYVNSLGLDPEWNYLVDNGILKLMNIDQSDYTYLYSVVYNNNPINTFPAIQISFPYWTSYTGTKAVRVQKINLLANTVIEESGTDKNAIFRVTIRKILS